jgi:hypothetical protein
MDTCGAEVPRTVTIEEGSSISCSIWLAKVPAMKVPR